MQEESRVYNLYNLQKMAPGDASFLQKMVLIYLKTMPVDFEKLVYAFTNKDWQNVHNAAHKIKATIDSMGISSIAENIRLVETLSSNDCTLHINTLSAAIEKIKTTIELSFVQLKQDFCM